MIHSEASALCGKTVTLKAGLRHPQVDLDGEEYRVEDWWDRVYGKSWGDCVGNPACLVYAIRLARVDLPSDDEVLYGKVGSFGHLIHVSEIEAATKEESDADTG